MSITHDRALSLIETVKNFPKAGVDFKDITRLLADPETFRYSTKRIADFIVEGNCDKVAAIDARGFAIGSAAALDAYAGLILIRKAGKLPRPVFSVECELEYGRGCLDIHKTDLGPGHTVAVVDDVLATGGTALAACKLVEMCGANVSTVVFLIEIVSLGGRKKLEGYNVESIFKL